MVHEYGRDVENVLRINYAGRKLIRNKEIASSIIATATDTPAPVINPALWPLILERAYKKSCYFFRGEEMLDRNMNVTGVFDLVLHYWPRLLKNRYKLKVSMYNVIDWENVIGIRPNRIETQIHCMATGGTSPSVPTLGRTPKIKTY